MNDEIEMQRIGNIKAAGKQNGNPGPGSFACHEAMHMASFLATAIDSELCQHFAITANPEWFRLAYEAQTKLLVLYQAIGAVHADAAEGER